MGGFSTCNIFTGFGSVRLSFIPLKATMEDTHFANYEEVKNGLLNGSKVKKQFYRRGIQLLPERWKKIIYSI